MSNNRWYNPNVPQTLAVAQWLLYLDAIFLGLGVLIGAGLGLLGAVAITGYLYGAYGIANEKRSGYWVAVGASLLPLALRIVQFASGVTAISGTRVGLGYVLFGHSILTVLFQYALVALLLHPMSRQHEKNWFS